MLSPSASHNVDIDAISGILGSISIACWVVVFSPQIIENFRRSSAEGLSIEFVIIWLVGDVFNILGAVLQGVLPTMIILAIYYTFADIVLLGQCFYYRGFTFRDPRPDKPVESGDRSSESEQTPLIGERNDHMQQRPLTAADIEPSARSRSSSSFRERFTSLDATHLSPAAPMHPRSEDPQAQASESLRKDRSWMQAIFFNSTAIVLVVIAGIAGYYLSPSSPDHQEDNRLPDDLASNLDFNLWGQIFGYICAVLYLGSRVPQLLLNYRRKSTEGLNALFFLFACLGNLTYVLSIFAFAPTCSRHAHDHLHEVHCSNREAGSIYGKYILVNLSWLLGSLGTLFLDFAVFVQFWMYRSKGSEHDAASRTLNDEGRGRERV